MANVNRYGNSDASRTQQLQDYANAARRERCSVKNGKGSSPRNNHSQSFRDNYDDIFKKKKTLAKVVEKQ